MYRLIISITLLHFATSDIYNHYELTLASTSLGTIKGQNKLSRYGKSFYSFTGIPYAKPPVEDLRFQEPQEQEPWNDTLDATKEPPLCIQRNYLFSTNPPIVGQEDCLYLNIYVPQAPYGCRDNCHDKKYPVMVFIHWGAFIAGGSSTGYLGPEYFLDRDIVLVTFNYRLGPFGFLSTTDDEAPGNYGLKDQVAALKWVQSHIEAFRGDKNNVTIFGQSAGGGSVHYHLLSAASEGLFHRAISQSGNALAGWSLPLNVVQKQLAFMQADFVGCKNYTSNSKELISCLRSVSSEDIMKTQDRFRKFFGNPLVLFGSVIETKSEKNPNPFLTKPPLEYILKGEIKNVPWMTGVVKNEGLVRAGSLIRSREVREALKKNFENLVSDALLLLSLSTANPHDLFQNVTEFYFNGKEFIDIEDPKNIQGVIDVYSDRGFEYPLYQAIQLHSHRQHAPIYLYNFEYESKFTYGELFAGTKEDIDYDWGPSHCDDLLYMFNSPSLFPKRSKWDDIRMSNILLNLWSNFAEYGNPNPPEKRVLANLNWNPVNLPDGKEFVNSDIEVLNISGNSKAGPKLHISWGFHEKRMKFWTDSDLFENKFELK